MELNDYYYGVGNYVFLGGIFGTVIYLLVYID